MAKRLNEENSIADVLKEFIQTNNLQKGMDKIDVREAWKKLMGNGVLNYTTEIVLKNETLYVGLSSAVLKEELSYGKEKIVNMLNEELGKSIIRNIIFR
ncbi:DUF721 domain-containing protein [Flavobacterium sp. NRK F10]|uniref:DUF721 domain-containing protein n=1 Tax=Flavobacterium sediminis TaxID=2201181 RepID=A0A2U8QW67_9FLAO|nr:MULTISPECIES: DUF721 domain-containing protein [Flavobacterium]AWM14437.1 DUF721 domain-containing protein [Flavobacterium sediminis]MCO6175665.1 DUF721 domain-containing protein [Flavobacterium sp. NRK F10]